MYGLAHEELMFWDVPMSDAVKPRIENTRMGRVTVSGGQLSIQEIIVQLQWIVPEESYQWEVVQVEDNVYRVNFPSKMDLVRVQHFGRFNVPNSEIFMTFDFWKRSVDPIWRADDVWVRVYDIPTPVLDDFLALWALGTLFGKTRDIDMVFTRANDVLRILITCLDPTLIPARMDIRVLDDFYRMRFEVEGLQPPPVADVVMNDANNGEGDMEHDGQNENGEHQNGKDTNTSGVEQGDTGTGGNNTSPVHVPGNNVALSPVKFGLVGTEMIVNKEVLSCVTKSPNVIFSATIQANLVEHACARMIDSAVAVETEGEVGEFGTALPPIIVDKECRSSGLVSQPNMHGASLNEVTSITAEVYDTRSLSPVRTPVGVTKVHHNFTSFFLNSRKILNTVLIKISCPRYREILHLHLLRLP
jgi:hypothetical protein